MANDLVDAARAYAVAKTKFRHRGRKPATGLDCAGLIVCSYVDLGEEVHDFLYYGREPFHNGLEKHVEQALGPAIKTANIVEADLQHNDVIIFRFATNPHHLAIIAAVDYAGQAAFNIIHADGLLGRVVEVRLTPDMVERITHLHRRVV